MSTRRQVLSGAAAALLTPGWRAFAAGRPYRVGVIGAAWMGRCNLFALMQVAPVEVVAFADVDALVLKDLQARTLNFPDSVVKPAKTPAVYRDYRDMLARHRFDIVIVATPDHWHALPAIAAMKAGAHVYLEKPISVDIAEGKALVAAARKYQRVVQVGTQRRASPPHAEARKLIEDGALGRVGLVELYGLYHQRPARFAPVTAPPKTLDWEFYCGPAPLVPYRPGIHPLNWRAFREFGNGYIADLGVHFIDCARWMLNLSWPKTISSEGGVFVDKQSAASVVDTQTAMWDYGDVIFTWKGRQWGAVPEGPAGGWGAVIQGEKGMLTLSSLGYEFKPARGPGARSGDLSAERKKFPDDAKLLPMDRELVPLTRPNMRDFIAAIEHNKRPIADVEEGYISTSTAILANIAMELGRSLHFDAKTGRLSGDEAANKKLIRPYRAPWVHPALSP